MIISRTPYRLSFFGGGTDYPSWYREYGGAVLATSINHYCYITCRFLPPFFEHKSRVVWSQIERVTDNAEIEHPVVRAVLDHLEIHQGVEIHHDGDLPARAGLGSSSSFTVGILNALYALKGQRISKMDLAKKAIYVEQDLLKENVGVQDQIQTAYGGLNWIEFLANDTFKVEPIAIAEQREQEFESHLLMFYTGTARDASNMAKAWIEAIPGKQSQLHQMREMVDQGIDILINHNDIADFGRLLHESWQLKRSLTDRIAPTFVNDIYDRAMGAGALGGKLLGAGGGGFMIFFVRPEDHSKVLNALQKLLVVPVAIEHLGSQIIFYDNPRYSRAVLEGAQFERHEPKGNGNGENAAQSYDVSGTAKGHPRRLAGRAKAK